MAGQALDTLGASRSRLACDSLINLVTSFAARAFARTTWSWWWYACGTEGVSAR
jgi:hypothetical protein